MTLICFIQNIPYKAKETEEKNTFFRIKERSIKKQIIEKFTDEYVVV